MSFPRIRLASGVLALAATFAAPASLGAQPTVVTLTDGRTLEGELVSQTDDRVVLRISGIDTPIDRETIAQIQERPSVEQQYKQRREALADDDLEGRYDLAYWLFLQNELDLALQEARALQQASPENERVNTLVSAIQSKLTLQEEEPAAPRSSASQGEGATQRPQPQAAQAGDGLPLLNDADINVIKVWELPEDLSGAAVRIRVPRETIERALRTYGASPAVPQSELERRRLLRATPQEQLDFLYRLGAAEPEARELYREVEVVGDPQTITDFRRGVYGNYVQRYFRRLFGEGQVPNFRLVPSNPDTNREIYTNFYILSETSLDGHPMIDRMSPADSLLLQWGLPRNVARFPAPDVPGWRPFFAGPQDPAFDRAVEWIESLYDGATVDYGIEYPAVGDASAAPSPADADATQPGSTGGSDEGGGAEPQQPRPQEQGDAEPQQPPQPMQK